MSVIGVPGEHYSVAVVLELMCKVPRDISINIRRTKVVTYEWLTGKFLEKIVARISDKLNRQQKRELEVHCCRCWKQYLASGQKQKQKLRGKRHNEAVQTLSYLSGLA